MAAQKKWFKGNLHTHTTNSDGDTAPEHVAEWYEENGYDWLCLTDHNHLTILDDPGTFSFEGSCDTGTRGAGGGAGGAG